MSYWLVPSIFILTTLQGLPCQRGTDEEAFLVRRIAEFWKDGDRDIVKKQISSFLERYPNSNLSDHIKALLADILLQEGELEGSLSIYKEITSTEVIPRILINKLQSMYELKLFDEMVESIYFFDKDESIDERRDEYNFLIAEALFRSSSHQDIPKARDIYISLIGGPFNDAVKFSLAELYQEMGDYKEASELFIELSLIYPERLEELLFHASLAQAQFDEELAIKTLTQVTALGGDKYREATINRILILFRMGEYQNVIDNYTTLKNIDLSPSLYYTVGSSYFHLGYYQSALTYLDLYISSGHNPTNRHNAYLTILESLQRLGDLHRYEDTLRSFEAIFPDDPQLPTIKFVRTMLMKAEKPQEVMTALEEIISRWPTNNSAINVEYGISAYEQAFYGISRDVFAELIENHPNHSQISLFWSYLIASSSHMENPKQLYDDLNKAIASNLIFGKELQDTILLQGQVAYDLSLYDDSITILSEYQNNFGETTESNLIIALSHHELGNNELFCHHAELALKGDYKENALLHLELFNVYMMLGDIYHEQAADHLYKAMILKDFNIMQENKLWLANHYFNLSSISSFPYTREMGRETLASNRARDILEHLLLDKKGELYLGDDHTLEWEAIRLSKIYENDGDFGKKIKLLKSLLSSQFTQKGLFLLHGEMLFELAKSYEDIGDRASAYESYLFASTLPCQSLSTKLSKIREASMRVDWIDTSRRERDDEEISDILDLLKGYQIVKHPSSEPLHLEAALEYANIRSKIVDKSDSMDTYLFFLHRIKEDFEEDPINTEYRELLSKDSKASLSADYLTFVDLEITKCTYFIAISNGKKPSRMAAELISKYKALLKKTPSHYLSYRIKESISLMRS